MNKLGTAVGGFLFAVAGTAGGATAPGKSDVYGPGVSSCGHWLSARADHTREEVAMGNWVSGFVTGAQTYDEGVYRESDVESFMAFVDKYCKENPLKRVAHAALALTFELKKRQ